MPFMQSARRFEYEHILTSNSWGEYDIAWVGIINEFMSDPRRPKRWKRKYDACIRKHVDDYNRRLEQTGERSLPDWVTPDMTAHINWRLISIVLCAGMSQKQMFTLLHLAYPAPPEPWSET